MDKIIFSAIIFFLVVTLFTVSMISAETTFFKNQDDTFIMGILNNPTNQIHNPYFNVDVVILQQRVETLEAENKMLKDCITNSKDFDELKVCIK